jgi:hypothetical protein
MVAEELPSSQDIISSTKFEFWFSHRNKGVLEVPRDSVKNELMGHRTLLQNTLIHVNEMG